MDKRFIVLTLFLLLGFVGSAALGDLNTGLVAHWQFEGNFQDSAGTNHATAKGDAKIVTDLQRGQVVEFDGTGDYLEVPNSPSLNITSDKITLAAWVWHDDVSGNSEIILAKVVNNTAHSSPYFAYGLHILTNGQPRVWISRTGGASSAVGTTNLQSAKWYHLAGVYDGAQLRLYLDGKLVGSTNVTGTLIGYDTVLRLGTNGGLTEQMDGKLDDVRIYNRALSDREILSLAAGTSLNTAWNPNPANGATGVSSPLLQWTAGDTAAFHNVYLGTNPNLGAGDFMGQQQFAMYWHAPGLAPGTTYYWRVDEVEIDGVTIHTGKMWSFSTPPVKAFNPAPADDARFVDTEADLTWSAGATALTHDVYFGTDETAVAGGTDGTFKGNQLAETYDPGTLAKGTTYYWRTDEVEADGITKHTGDVWRFRTIPDIPITDPDLVGWWKFDEGTGGTVIDWSGHGNHATAKGDAKIVTDAEQGQIAELDGTGDYLEIPNSPSLNITGNEITLASWVYFDDVSGPPEIIIAKVYQETTHASPYFSYGLHLLSNGQPRFWLRLGTASRYVPGTVGMIESQRWYHVAGVYNGSQMILYVNGEAVATGDYTGNITGYNTVLRLGTNGGLTEQMDGKLDDVRIYNRALTADEIKEAMRGDVLAARNPSPGNGATTDVVGAATLTWEPGEKAIQHDVYVGTDPAAVEAADASDATGIYRGRQNVTSYTPDPALDEWGREYFWRVDEVNSDGTITTGYLWSFTVADYLIVDDFESYTDDEGSRIYETWIDGVTTGLTGSTVGYLIAPFAERTIVHSGKQSMPLDYNNVRSPYYSEAERTFDAPQDWTVNGVNILLLHVRGHTLAGFVSFDSATQTYTMTGAGSNIWAAKDEFHFAYKELNGDGSITVRVDSMSANPPHGDPRIGVMIRDSLDPNAANATLFVEPDPRTRLTQRVRVAADTTDVAVANVGATPTWIRLTREGFKFRAERSDNGTSWAPLLATGSEANIYMTDPVFIGLVKRTKNFHPPQAGKKRKIENC